MKYHQIRARRAEGSAVSAPEYAVNCLNVDILFAKGRTDVRELSVRLYTSAYQLMGVAARQAFSGKAIRTWHYTYVAFRSLFIRCLDGRDVSGFCLCQRRSKLESGIVSLHGRRH